MAASDTCPVGRRPVRAYPPHERAPNRDGAGSRQDFGKLFSSPIGEKAAVGIWPLRTRDGQNWSPQRVSMGCKLANQAFACSVFTAIERYCWGTPETKRRALLVRFPSNRAPEPGTRERKPWLGPWL